MRKAQGISINTIIIAAIALIVLVIIIAVFSGRMGIWGQGLDDQLNQDCSAVGAPVLNFNCKNGIIPGSFDLDPGYVCCKKSADDS